jgi:hypothetical protein
VLTSVLSTLGEKGINQKTGGENKRIHVIFVKTCPGEKLTD